jgi:L-rhamnose mutarotase
MLKVRPGAAEAYEKTHCEVWPEMLSLLKRAGITEYSIYRRDDLLIPALQTDDFDATWSRIDDDPVNLRWQAAMAPYFATAAIPSLISDPPFSDSGVTTLCRT